MMRYFLEYWADQISRMEAINMAIRFSNRKTQRFYFQKDGKDKSYVIIYGEEVDTKPGTSFKGEGHTKVTYRGRTGAIKHYKLEGGVRGPDLRGKRTLEMYFLDVGQGDAAFVVTPNNTKILVDGGLKKTTTADFLIWKYRLDKPANQLTINHLFLSHADADHVKGLIPILEHPRIAVQHIWHNGIALYDSGFNEALGNVVDGTLHTLHSSLDDLAGKDLTETFKKWTDAVRTSGATYLALDRSTGTLDIGDAEIQLQITGPHKLSDSTLKWLGDKSHTINGHSLTFRLIHDHVRVLFSGDMNVEGSKHILAQPGAALGLDSHVFKSPHHGSHEFHQPFLNAVRPVITVVSSGDSPDHGHPRASFLGGIGKAGRTGQHLIFSTEIAATFTEDGEQEEPVADVPEDMDPALMFSTTPLNTQARKRFKKALSGIINVRSNGRELYAARRVTASYQWESYDPIDAMTLS